MIYPAASFTDSSPEHFSKLLQRNAFAFGQRYNRSSVLERGLS
jgi:hypothetical protein